MKLATWNVNSLRARLAHVAAWCEQAAPDVLCLQETKVIDADFPHDEMAALGFTHRAIYGQKSYNGVAILSKFPLTDVRHGFLDGTPDPQTRLLRARVEGVEILNSYVPNGMKLGSDKYTYKLDWLDRLRAELARHHDPSSPTVLVGDLNIAPTDADTFDPFASDGQVLCTEPERARFQSLLDWGFLDSWRKRNPFASGYSWWDYRGTAFRFNHGFRIDHVLCTPSLDARITAIDIAREPRSWDTPSDHAPVIVAFAP